ncbi:hypothetical protein GT037_010860 [Alternaria burnsii]|uniref:Heterokaryon incompatibility domain-containing protein n=1 Tax=Alternaria burnsii TaxID=1187904 RepID=A0A8H7B1C1_9PLEO|nr:uncharacterized protein GT037_010860 [Alternaria burnsii]KAF7671079.1 hypothetical protein GT037_010860 [Alternaria burnsii]
MSLSACDGDHKAKTFSYTSLDLSQRSIRLLLLHPDRSESGHIECTLRDATVNDDYVCLSYVWGQPDKGYTVIINGRPHRVRINLYRFLQQARKKDLGWLWIDALCIDQENLAERTHQVQQMGSIYSRASRVISWLGSSPDMANVLRNVENWIEGYELDTDVGILFAHEYWTRAWVTQEVVLARRHTLMADGTMLPMNHLHPLLGPTDDSRHLIRLLQLQDVSPNYFHGRRLVHLLEEFRMQECAIPHDRVFSLLALCGQGSDLEVDYEASVEEILWRICYTCTFCLCSLDIVSRTLLHGPDTWWKIDRPMSSFTFLRSRYAEVRTHNVQRRGNHVFFGHPRGTLYTFDHFRFDESTDGYVCLSSYTAVYLIPTGRICRKYGWDGDWYLALCVSSSSNGFDFFHLPGSSNTIPDSAEIREKRLNFQTQHWPDDLKVVYDKPGSCTIRLPLAFWIELVRSRTRGRLDSEGYYPCGLKGRGGLKISFM